MFRVWIILLVVLFSASGQSQPSTLLRGKNYAQELVDQVVARHPELLVVAMHVTPPNDKQNIIVASNIGRLGKVIRRPGGEHAKHQFFSGPPAQQNGDFLLQFGPRHEIAVFGWTLDGVAQGPDAVRDEKVKVLRSIRPISKRSVHAHAFRAQYAAGSVNGEHVLGYAQEEGVEKDSITETYAAAKFYIDNWRWRGVPFYLRTGKRLAQQTSMIAIRFKHPPQQLFRETPVEVIAPNWVLLSLQPEESMHMEIHVKKPGLEMDTRVLKLNASYLGTGEAALDAYENLLLDVIEGDRTLFIRFDEVEWAWRVVDPILKYWAMERDYIHTYPAGTWGLHEAGRLFDGEDQEWRNEV